MGRLDSWLNGQVGWRLVALTWLIFCPLAVGVGSLIWGWFALQHPACEQLSGAKFTQECEPRLSAGLLVVAALSVLAAGPFAVLLAVVQRWWAARNPGKHFLSCCKIACLWCLSAAPLLDTFIDQVPSGRRTYYFDAELVLIAAAAVFFLADVRRRRERPGG